MDSHKNQQFDNASPLVSVCIPTYRDTDFLGQCLQSIIDQTYSNIEIIVGDDASPDNTAEIVRSFHDERIRYIRNPVNFGQFENVNRLIDQARGKYIAIYHSDDYYSREIIFKEISFLESHPEVGAVFALDWRVNDNGQIIGKMKLVPEIRTNVPLTLFDTLPILLRHRNRVFRTPTFMGRADVLRSAGPFSSAYEIAGDLEMWLRIARLSTVAILDEYLMSYRRGPSQVSSGYDRLRTHEDHFFAIMDQCLGLMPSDIRIDPLVMLEYCYHRRADETFRAMNCARLGRLHDARELLRQPFPWRVLFVHTPDLHFRKLVVVIQRILLNLGLALGNTWLLSRLLRQPASRPNRTSTADS